MKIQRNIFGTGQVYEQEDLQGKIYTICCACMSIYSEFLSFANANESQITSNPQDADNIIVLSCQVTDMAVLNDIRTMERLQKEYSNKKYFIGGCLSYRFDIDLPANVNRIGHIRTDYQPVDKKLIDYQAPFWVKNYQENQDKYADGHLFRNNYPLRIGVGCKNHCTFCTIRITRGESYEINPIQAEKEFIEHDNILLISDSPTLDQINSWGDLAIKHNKPISIRNIEPQIAMSALPKLYELASLSFLKELHVPVQHTNPDVLALMHRNIDATLKYINETENLKKKNVFLATNIIIKYKNFPDPDYNQLRFFDYISWNPYWDGKWNRVIAEKKYKELYEI